VVVHVVIPSSGADAAEAESMARPARGGVVVGRRVGPAVRRNLVKRRLRELLRTRLPDLPSGALVVVRALPEAGTASFDGLREDVDSALRAALSRGARQVPK
jgi:ribonuclease P protein component